MPKDAACRPRSSLRPTRIAAHDQLKAALEQWVAAVAQRDDVIKQAGQQIQKLAGRRNDAMIKFNDLAGKYNGLVKQIEAAKVALSGGVA